MLCLILYDAVRLSLCCRCAPCAVCQEAEQVEVISSTSMHTPEHAAPLLFPAPHAAVGPVWRAAVHHVFCAITLDARGLTLTRARCRPAAY